MPAITQTQRYPKKVTRQQIAASVMAGVAAVVVPGTIFGAFWLGRTKLSVSAKELIIPIPLVVGIIIGVILGIWAYPEKELVRRVRWVAIAVVLAIAVLLIYRWQIGAL